MINWKITFLIVFLGGLYACKSKEYSPNEYVKWIKNPANGLSLTKEISDYSIGLQYKPNEYLALLDSKGDNITDTTFIQLCQSYQGMDYYDLKISLKDKSKDILSQGLQSASDYYQRVNYFSFQIAKAINKVSGQDTLPCKLCHFERSYGLSPDCNFSIGFESSPNNKNETKIIYDDEVLGIGKVEFNINKQALSKLPKLKYKQL